MTLIRTIVEFSLVLGVMVLVHEFGHFIVAKMCGVRIETFSIGFGPRLFGILYKGTDYRISALPLGGYVKMAGEMGTNSADAPDALGTGAVGEMMGLGSNSGPFAVRSITSAPDDFVSKTRFQRILIALAGPFANFVLSFVLLAFAAHYHHEVDTYLDGSAHIDYVMQNSPAAHIGMASGDTILRFKDTANPTWEQILDDAALNLNRSLPITFLHDGRAVSAALPIAAQDESEMTPEGLFEGIGLIPLMQPGPVVVKDVSANTPAARAGLQPGDQIVRVDGLSPHSVQTLHAYLKDRNGAPAAVTVLRGGQPVALAITPEFVAVDSRTSQFQLGFTPLPAPVDVVRLPLGKAVASSFQDNRTKSSLLLRILQGLFTRHVSVKQMSGPVGIAQQIDIAFKMGLWPLVELTSFISINLAIFNLLPFPPLDGGMIFFLLVETLIRRDVNQQLKERVYQIAFVCIIGMFVFVMFNDITRLHLGR